MRRLLLIVLLIVSALPGKSQIRPPGGGGTSVITTGGVTSAHIASSNFARAVIRGSGAAYVRTNGNDSNAVLGREDFPFRTVTAANAALPTNGVAYIGPGDFDFPAVPKAGIVFMGAGRCLPNTIRSGFLPGGTRITNTIFIASNNVALVDITADLGTNTVNAHYGGSPTDAIIIGSYAVNVSGVKLIRVNAMAVKNNAAHSVSFEGASNVHAEDVQTFDGGHGFVTKVVGGTFNRIVVDGAELLVKANTGSPAGNLVFNDCVVRNGAGLIFLGTDNMFITNVTVNDFRTENTGGNFSVYLENVPGSVGAVNGLTINNLTALGGNAGFVVSGGHTNIVLKGGVMRNLSGNAFLIAAASSGWPENITISDLDARNVATFGSGVNGSEIYATNTSRIRLERVHIQSPAAPYAFRSAHGLLSTNVTASDIGGSAVTGFSSGLDNQVGFQNGAFSIRPFALSPKFLAQRITGYPNTGMDFFDGSSYIGSIGTLDSLVGSSTVTNFGIRWDTGAEFLMGHAGSEVLRLSGGDTNSRGWLTVPGRVTAGKGFVLPDGTLLNSGSQLGGGGGGAASSNYTVIAAGNVVATNSVLPGATTATLGSSSLPFASIRVQAFCPNIRTAAYDTPFNVALSDYVVNCNRSSATLPAASSCPNQVFVLGAWTGGAGVTINRTGSDLFQGPNGNDQTAYTVPEKNAYTFISTGSGWLVMH